MLRSHRDSTPTWDQVHGMWPATITRHLNREILPEGFAASAYVHVGQTEIDIATFDVEQSPTRPSWEPPSATAIAECTTTADTYEVRVERKGTLVAAIELVSPANKDRETSRDQFVHKCVDLLRRGVCVVVIDVLEMPTNLFALLSQVLTGSSKTTRVDSYATSARIRDGQLESWDRELEIGKPLPSDLPLWITAEAAVPLDLATTYDDVLRDLRAV